MAVIAEKASRFQSMSNRFTFSSAYPLTVGKTILRRARYRREKTTPCLSRGAFSPRGFFSERTRPHKRTAFCVIAVQAASCGYSDDASAHLDGCGFAADRDRALKRSAGGTVAVHGPICQKHGNCFSIAADRNRVAHGNRAFERAGLGIAAFHGRGVFENGNDAVGMERHSGDQKGGNDGLFHKALPAVRVTHALLAIAALAVGIAVNHGLLAVDHGGLRVVNRCGAHLLVRLHVNRLRLIIGHRPRVIDRRGGRIDGRRVNGGALALVVVVVEARAISECESPGTGLCEGSQGECDGGYEKDCFFHRICRVQNMLMGIFIRSNLRAC